MKPFLFVALLLALTMVLDGRGHMVGEATPLTHQSTTFKAGF